MNENKKANTEHTILQCAEEVFMERGFDGAKTTEIARRAGVNHAMIHYYFRTKLNLFNVVFQDKLALLATSFADAFLQDVPFFEKIEFAIQSHFDFIAAHPRLLFFLYSEVVNDEERKHLLIKNVLPTANEMLPMIQKDIDEEVSKGTIRKVKPLDLFLNIISLNITTFLTLPLVEILIDDSIAQTKFLEERKHNNVQTIINSIKLTKEKQDYRQTSLDF